MNSFQDADPNAPSCGTLHIIEEASRPSSWVLNGGTQTSFTDVDFSAYVPVGVKQLKLKWYITWTGDGSKDYSFWNIRKNGSSITDSDQLRTIGEYYSDLPNGVTRALFGEGDFDCDTSGIIEYRFWNGGTAVGSISINIVGYYI